jgi:hypothetical protein
MRRSRATMLAAVATLALAACGSDDKGSSGNASGGTDLQDQAADAAIEAAAAENFELDENCVRGIASRLSDDDARKIVDAGPEGDADLSTEGEALSLELVRCIDSDTLIDQFIEGMGDGGQDFDEACVREQLEGVDVAELIATSEGSGTPSELVSSLMECFDLGS